MTRPHGAVTRADARERPALEEPTRPGPDEVGRPPAAAATVFGSRLPLAERYARWLATEAVVRGLIGPREAPRMWDRHLLNCALVADLIPHGARVVDVGSGAGLPGVVLAVRRPDLRVDLVEPLLRRSGFLEEVVADLDLAGSVRVVRGRAEDVRDSVGDAAWVVARAVAPLDRLVTWCLPLLAPDGRLLAMKGESVAAELIAHRSALRRLHVSADLREVGEASQGGVTRVVVVRRTGPREEQRR